MQLGQARACRHSLGRLNAINDYFKKSKGRDCSSRFGLRLLAFYQMAVCGRNYRQHRQRTCTNGREIVMQESGDSHSAG